MKKASGRCFGLAAALLAGLGASPVLANDRGQLEILAGLGYVMPSGDAPGEGSGILGQVEYSLPQLEYLRFYAGGLWANTTDDSCSGEVVCELKASVFFLGSKLRLTAPIPYVRPYVDLGVGLSLGEMVVRSGFEVDARAAGVMLHLPVGIGLEIGRQPRVDVSVQLMFHPAADGVAGALALGFAFGL